MDIYVPLQPGLEIPPDKCVVLVAAVVVSELSLDALKNLVCHLVVVVCVSVVHIILDIQKYLL